ncbi:MAG: M28 family peptidase [candidate division Zixibacteria bacterium]|nr:M28 family peptidase [candidate division Zixibacteria bacterium]
MIFADRYRHRIALPDCLTVAPFCLWILVALGCSHPKPQFDPDRAFRDLVTQTQFGPRVPGSDAHARCAEWLLAQLQTVADSVWEQDFTGYSPGAGDSVPMVNIVARFGGDASRRVLVSAHWDTRPFADMDPDSSKHGRHFDGANDGGSGVAVLLEMARCLDSLPPPIGVDFVFYDGEDGGDYQNAPGTWCLGSRYFASHLPGKYQWAINLDMVGDADLRLPQEGYSLKLARPTVERLWALASRLGETAFAPEPGQVVFDDHVPLLMHGIPAVDVIDLDYPYWHTTGDTAEHCSASSLGTVGRVVLEMMYSE